jgi:glycerophosphoryl diester phosphodiesterase
VVTLIEKYVHEKMELQFIVSSFDWNALKEVSLAIPIGVLTETDLDLALAFAKFIRAQSIHPYFHLLTAANTKNARRGIPSFPWTINEIEDIKE